MLFFLILCSSIDGKKDSKSPQNLIRDDSESNPEYGCRALKILQRLVPKEVLNMEDLVHVGNKFVDGGYNMLNDWATVTHAYSVGIGRDYSWDLEIASRGIKVSMFDHTIKPPVVKNPLLKFYGYGINFVDVLEKKLLTLDSLIKLDNNSGQTNMLLKMDVEGAEWDVLSRSSILDKFSQIVCELHWFKKMIKSKDKFDLAIRALENLNKTHQLISVHGIPAFWRKDPLKHTHFNVGGIPIVDQLEVTFVKRKEGLNFVDHNSTRKRPDVRTYKDTTEPLLWWVESGKYLDFDGLIKKYCGMIPEKHPVKYEYILDADICSV